MRPKVSISTAALLIFFKLYNNIFVFLKYISGLLQKKMMKLVNWQPTFCFRQCSSRENSFNHFFELPPYKNPLSNVIVVYYRIWQVGMFSLTSVQTNAMGYCRRSGSYPKVAPETCHYTIDPPQISLFLPPDVSIGQKL